MGIIDRYVVRNFFRVFLICIVCISGMYLVIDFVNNLSEFVDHVGSREDLGAILAAYYGARLPWFFDLTSRIIALTSAVFVITLLQRHNEMASLMAAGISRRRIVAPLVFATLAISLLAAVNREVGIPAARHQLCRRSRDWAGDGGRDLHPAFDNLSGIWIGGDKTYSNQRRIAAPTFRLPSGLSDFGRRIIARQAYFQDADNDHPNGYRLLDVATPDDLSEIPSARSGGAYVIYSPHDAKWLKKNECFVVSNVDFEHLESGLDWYQLSSTFELLRGLRNDSLDLAADLRVLVHSRLIQPLLDMTLIFLGLPIVLSRERRNVFVAVGLCVLLVAGFSIVVLGCQALGRNYLIRPALAAWAPLMIFVPIAVALSGSWKR